jgi:hypothetical protein
MTIRALSDIANAYTAGRHWTGYFRRGGPSMTASLWTDMSYAAGIPVANYYAAAPYVSSLLSPNDGILHGPNVNAAGFKKYLHKAMLMPVAAIGQAVFYIHDIVMFYPFVDGDGGEQPMDNQISIPRYGGLGCKIMLVSQGAGIANAQDTIITYTDYDGVQQTWQGFTANANTAGQLMSGPTSGTQPSFPLSPTANPYILSQGARGVRSIDTINMLSGVGGIFAACIVKPIAVISMQINETTPIEVDYAQDRLRIPMTEIQDGAYVHMIGQSSSTAAPATMHGEFSFVWI